MKTLVLVNPTATRVRKDGSLLQAVADRRDIPLDLLEDDWQPERATTVFIEGGDGTVSRTISAYLGSDLPLPRFALVKGGRTDQVAGVIGLRKQGTQALLDAVDGGLDPWEVPLLEVQTDRTHHGFLFSTGAIPQVTERIGTYRGDRNRAGSELAGLRLVGKAVLDATRPGSRVLEKSPATVRASTDAEEVVLEGEHLGTIATTLHTLYAGLDPFWGEGAGALRVTYAAGDASALLPTILGMWAGRRNRDTLRLRGFQSFNAHSLHVRAGGGMVLDGEPLDTSEATVRPTRPVTFLR